MIRIPTGLPAKAACAVLALGSVPGPAAADGTLTVIGIAEVENMHSWRTE